MMALINWRRIAIVIAYTCASRLETAPPLLREKLSWKCFFFFFRFAIQWIVRTNRFIFILGIQVFNNILTSFAMFTHNYNGARCIMLYNVTYTCTWSVKNVILFFPLLTTQIFFSHPLCLVVIANAAISRWRCEYKDS